MSIVSFFDQFPEYNGRAIEIRGADGYISISDLNAALGKRFADWRRTKFAKELLDELSLIYRMPTGVENRQPLRQKALIERDAATSKVYAHPAVGLSYSMSNPRFQARINAWILSMKEYGTATPHIADWTAMEYLRGVEFNRDDIRDMYG